MFIEICSSGRCSRVTLVERVKRCSPSRGWSSDWERRSTMSTSPRTLRSAASVGSCFESYILLRKQYFCSFTENTILKTNTLWSTKIYSTPRFLQSPLILLCALFLSWLNCLYQSFSGLKYSAEQDKQNSFVFPGISAAIQPKAVIGAASTCLYAVRRVRRAAGAQLPTEYESFSHFHPKFDECSKTNGVQHHLSLLRAKVTWSDRSRWLSKYVRKDSFSPLLRSSRRALLLLSSHQSHRRSVHPDAVLVPATRLWWRVAEAIRRRISLGCGKIYWVDHLSILINNKHNEEVKRSVFQEQSSNIAYLFTNSEPLIETTPTFSRVIDISHIGAREPKPLDEVSYFLQKKPNNIFFCFLQTF